MAFTGGLSEAQQRQLLCQTFKIPTGATRSEEGESLRTWQEVWRAMQNSDRLASGYSPDDLLWFPEKIQIGMDIRRGRSSKLREYIMENNGAVLLVADTVFSGGKSVFLVKRLDSLAELVPWLREVSPTALSLRVQGSPDDWILAMVNLECFVR